MTDLFWIDDLWEEEPDNECTCCAGTGEGVADGTYCVCCNGKGYIVLRGEA